MALLTYSQIALIVSGIKCFGNSFFYALEKPMSRYQYR